MSRYRERVEVTTLYRRCHRVVINNPMDGFPRVTFEQQDVTEKDGRTFLTNSPDFLSLDYDPEAMVQLLDPDTLQPTGEVVPQKLAYAILLSAYIHTAKERDAQEAELPPA